MPRKKKMGHAAVSRFGTAVRLLPEINVPGLSYSLPQLKVLPVSPRVRDATQEKIHRFESAEAFLNRLAARIRSWRAELPKDAQPVILVVLPNGATLNVDVFANEGHNAVVVKGRLGHTECLFMAHQTSLQLLCYIEKAAAPPKKIGFRIGEEELEE